MRPEEKRQAALAAAIVAIVYVALHFLGMGCPIKYLTGVSCAGCGMTRAWLAALAGDWAAAFRFHPLFWAVPVGAALYLLRRRLPRRLLKTALWAGCGLFLAVYLVRLADPADPAVVFEPENGLFFRILRRLPL